MVQDGWVNKVRDRSHQNPGFPSRLWLGLSNKSLWLNLGKGFFSVFTSHEMSPLGFILVEFRVRL